MRTRNAKQIKMFSKDDYELLVDKASLYCDFKADLDKIKSYYSRSLQSPLMDPHVFEKVCNNVGAEKLYSIFGATCPHQISNQRKYLTKIRATVIIYIMMYSLSKKADWLQIALPRTLQQFGITERTGSTFPHCQSCSKIFISIPFT